MGKALKGGRFKPQSASRKRKGGRDALDNLTALCRECHERIHGRGR
ncbi:MAG: HNH endonuclease [Actinobacteria bacterium]|nr:HNH endonuclease [Actinomycetota bacterium]